MPLYEYKCTECDCIFEEIVKPNTHEIKCPICESTAKKIYRCSAKTLKTIIPSYPGCLKNKAGYVHTHGDKPATKIQSGYTGTIKK